MSKLVTGGFQDCCGINITSGFSTEGTLRGTDKPFLDKLASKGISLVALSHYQWKPELLTLLTKLGFEPICQDFYNAGSANRITLFARVDKRSINGSPGIGARLGNPSSAWVNAEKVLNAAK